MKTDSIIHILFLFFLTFCLGIKPQPTANSKTAYIPSNIDTPYNTNNKVLDSLDKVYQDKLDFVKTTIIKSNKITKQSENILKENNRLISSYISRKKSMCEIDTIYMKDTSIFLGYKKRNIWKRFKTMNFSIIEPIFKDTTLKIDKIKTKCQD